MKKIIFCMIALVLVAFLTIPANAQMKNEDCLTCHSDKELEATTERGKGLTLHVAENALVGSVHEELSCTDCHKGASSFEDVPHAKGALTQACGECHEEAANAMKLDVHGVAANSDNPRSPSCSSCHGGHQIKPLSSVASVVSKKNQPENMWEVSWWRYLVKGRKRHHQAEPDLPLQIQCPTGKPPEPGKTPRPVLIVTVITGFCHPRRTSPGYLGPGSPIPVRNATPSRPRVSGPVPTATRYCMATTTCPIAPPVMVTMTWPVCVPVPGMPSSGPRLRSVSGATAMNE